MTTPLLIVEDDPEITSALVRGLRLHGFDALAENRAARALDRLCSGRFACAIVDVMLGTDSGLDLVRAARARGAVLPILMLSALSDVEHRAAGLEAGADDYVVKPFSLDELVARLRVQERRAERQQPAQLLPDRRLIRGGAEVVLTEREYALLRLLLAHSEAPMPRHAIFEALWAVEGSANENVVDVYIGYLRKKLVEGDFGFEIRTIRNQGFVVEGQAPQTGTP
jgi:DNA-binding response OmpR family regulator